MSYESRLKSTDIDELFRAVMKLSSEEECYRFFEDLCTVHELRSLAQRWEVARMLDAGSTYQAIADKTGASTATISRVSRCLLYGADGYKTLLARALD